MSDKPLKSGKNWKEIEQKCPTCGERLRESGGGIAIFCNKCDWTKWN